MNGDIEMDNGSSLDQTSDLVQDQIENGHTFGEEPSSSYDTDGDYEEESPDSSYDTNDGGGAE